MATMGVTAGTLAFAPTSTLAAATTAATKRKKGTPTVLGAFTYPPSKKLEGNWWSWPGNDFDAEGRQKQYSRAIEKIAQDLGMRITMQEEPLDGNDSVTRFINQAKDSKPDAVLLIPLKHSHFANVDRILAEVAPKISSEGKTTKPGIPAVIYSCLGVKHGPITAYRKPGIHMIQALDNMGAIEYGMRMVKARKSLKESRIISVAGEVNKEATVPFWGTQVRVVTLKQFVDEVNRTKTTNEAKDLARAFVENAEDVAEPAQPEIVTAAKVHFAVQRILEEQDGDAIMMDCLRRGEYMPCMSFMTLRDQGIAAGCENDLGPTLTMMLVQDLFNRPGFQHNPAYETEANHYFASHCTSASKLYGLDKPSEPYLLRNYAHTNDPTCAPQILFREGEDVTMAHCHPGEPPNILVYSGNVVKSHAMPPVGGCRTNVEITINELDDVCDVKGHHNVLFYGNHVRRLKKFAQMYGIRVIS